MSKVIFHHNCLEQGGAERVVSNLANAFVDLEDDVIVATEWFGDNEYELDNRVRRIHVGLSSEDESKGRITKMWVRLRNLRELVKKEQPDIIIGFTRKPLFRTIMAAIGTDVPVAIAVRANPWGLYNDFFSRLSVRFLFPRVDGAVFQTEMQKSFFPKYIHKKSKIILNPVNKKFFQEEDIEKEKLVISTGRLDKLKNQEMLFKAFIRVHDKFPEYILELFGEDSFDGTKENLEKIITDNHAEEFIRLMGGSDQLEKELPRAEVFAFASNSEGMPNSILEAMCMGVPVVATDCPSGGPATIIENGVNGILTKINDEDEFVAAIEKILNDKRFANELGENAKKIRDRVDADVIVSYWRDFIRQTIERRKNKR